MGNDVSLDSTGLIWGVKANLFTVKLVVHVRGCKSDFLDTLPKRAWREFGVRGLVPALGRRLVAALQKSGCGYRTGPGTAADHGSGKPAQINRNSPAQQRLHSVDDLAPDNLVRG